ncbi:MAG: tRNA pseudouridine(38-40) synthase TruA [bacterium]|nr:tRNA pseudouridine(38-40) synthase TruA [bacterium]
MNIRLEASVQYDGTDFSGWQVQPGRRTVQGEIEKILQKRFNDKIRITGSGRTDTGVHAANQIVHFDCPEIENIRKLLKSLNSLLPDDISIDSLEKTSPEFHARFDAVSRQYSYSIHKLPSALNRRYSWEVLTGLNTEKMIESLVCLIGTHNFEPLSKLNPEQNSYLCTVFHTGLQLEENKIVFRIRANRFMHGMVRAITGTLVDIGREASDAGIFRTILDSNDRTLVSSLAPAHGLCLERVNY